MSCCLPAPEYFVIGISSEDNLLWFLLVIPILVTSSDFFYKSSSQVNPGGVFLLPPAGVQELQLKVQPWRAGSRFLYVNAVDVDQRQLVTAWLLCLNVNRPVLSKVNWLKSPCARHSDNTRRMLLSSKKHSPCHPVNIVTLSADWGLFWPSDTLYIFQFRFRTSVVSSQVYARFTLVCIESKYIWKDVYHWRSNIHKYSRNATQSKHR